MTSTVQRATVDLDRYLQVRGLTEQLAGRLTPEDQVVQSAPHVSPTKWHRAHTTWFFETFLLGPRLPGYREFDPAFGYLFNSYYNSIGEQYPRPDRGLISRPGVAEVAAYRAHVDAAMSELLAADDSDATLDLVELGLNHEQQHQELVLMDIKHVFAQNPLKPAFVDAAAPAREAAPSRWVSHGGGFVDIGFSGDGFCYDNERPAHRAWLTPFSLATRPVTNGDWLDFMADGGYERPELWLSDGWIAVTERGWNAPEYWSRVDGSWSVFTLGGARPVDPAEPVCHVSYYEADAFAHWAGARLPTEFEWEAAAQGLDVDGNLLEPSVLHPRAGVGDGLTQMFGDVWEWTASAYLPYPGYRAPEGAVGEYNGKFMVNQHVLRGGSCVTPQGHIRPTYRNFFPPDARWAFSGVRLAKDD